MKTLSKCEAISTDQSINSLMSSHILDSVKQEALSSLISSDNVLSDLPQLLPHQNSLLLNSLDTIIKEDTAIPQNKREQKDYQKSFACLSLQMEQMHIQMGSLHQIVKTAMDANLSTMTELLKQSKLDIVKEIKKMVEHSESLTVFKVRLNQKYPDC